MNAHWVDQLRSMTVATGRTVRVSIVRADGSAPQGVGAAMTVGPDAFVGTVGGGALELAALREARKLLRAPDDASAGSWWRMIRDFPLGPSLGQCCGGYVQILFEVIGSAEIDDIPTAVSGAAVVLRPLTSGTAWRFVGHRKGDDEHWPLPVRRRVRELLSGVRMREAACIEGWYVEPVEHPAQPLFLYGAGHVGRAVVRVLEDLPFQVYWVDVHADRYPERVSGHVHKLVSADPVRATEHAPSGAWHLVMSYSHTLDFDICRSVLARGDYGYLGVIASKTKRARFVRRLREAGIDGNRIQDLHAPVGLAGLDGKLPATIAVSVAADFLLRLEQGCAERRWPQTEEARGGL